MKILHAHHFRRYLGLVKAIIDEIEEGDPDGDFGESLDDKIIESMFSKKNRRCSGSKSW